MLELPLEEPDDRDPLDDAELALDPLTRLVADRIADELRDDDCAPLVLDTDNDPSAPTDVEPPPDAPPLDVPVARDVTVVDELRDELNDRLSRPNPDRDPLNCGASNCANRSAPVDPVSRIVFAIRPAAAFAVRTSTTAPFFCSAEACRRYNPAPAAATIIAPASHFTHPRPPGSGAGTTGAVFVTPGGVVCGLVFGTGCMETSPRPRSPPKGVRSPRGGPHWAHGSSSSGTDAIVSQKVIQTRSKRPRRNENGTTPALAAWSHNFFREQRAKLP